MVEVLKRGVPPSQRVITCQCVECESELQFFKGEAVKKGNPQKGVWLEIACPVCGATLEVLE